MRRLIGYCVPLVDNSHWWALIYNHVTDQEALEHKLDYYNRNFQKWETEKEQKQEYFILSTGDFTFSFYQDISSPSLNRLFAMVSIIWPSEIKKW